MAKGNLLRWMYRDKRPNWIAKFLNKITAVLASSGLASNYLETLEVTGRKSGRIFSLPVVIAIVNGQQYLVSMLGENVQWVQNVRAAGGKAVLRSGRRVAVTLVDVATDQRAPILKAYLKRAPGARPHISVDKEAPLVKFEEIAADYPTFRIIRT
jgi:deazaflavin-dependent oxidoreductase (nitroreductase family)